MSSVAKRFANDRSGNFTLITSVSALVLLGIAGFAVNTIAMDHEQSALQDSLDGAVLAGAGLGYSATDNQRITEAEKFLSREGYAFGTVDSAGFDTKAKSAVFRVEDKEVVGQATIQVANLFGGIVGQKYYPINVEARAAKRSSDPVCFHALNPSESGAIQLYGNATMEADCPVMANSQSTAGILTWGKKSWAKASDFGVTGSFSGEFTPVPKTDVFPLDDQYAALPVPVPGSCADVADAIKKMDVTLDPGTYCGGLTIRPGATVTLNPGVYVFEDGALEVSAGSVLKGNEVTLAFVGDDAIFLANANSKITLTSPVKGTYKNIQFMSDRTLHGSWKGQEWTTISSSDIAFDGVMYMPEQDIWIKGNTVFRGQSPTMIVTVDQFWIQDGSKITISRRNDRKLDMSDRDDGFRYASRLVE